MHLLADLLQAVTWVFAVFRPSSGSPGLRIGVPYILDLQGRCVCVYPRSDWYVTSRMACMQTLLKLFPSLMIVMGTASTALLLHLLFT